MMRVGQIPKCGCGRTKHPDGYCDGSHAQVKERDVKVYLLEQGKKHNALLRKVKWEGRRDAPDWLVAQFGKPPVLAELKRPGKEPTTAQLLEHALLRSYGLDVRVVASCDDVDALFA